LGTFSISVTTRVARTDLTFETTSIVDTQSFALALYLLPLSYKTQDRCRVEIVVCRARIALLFEEFQPIAAIATTPAAVQQLLRLSPSLAIELWVPESLTPINGTKFYTGSLKTHLATLWSTHRSFIFCLATGAVSRLIAPLLSDKSSDPAVIVMDEAGEFVISLCGGHQGGADRLTQLIALQLGATPVITGASHELNLPGIDILGCPFGWVKGDGNWTGVSAAIARQAPVQVIQTAGSQLWQHHLPPHHSFQFKEFNQCNQSTSSDQVIQAKVWISHTSPQSDDSTSIPTVYWHPRVLWVGIGCERGTSHQVIEAAVQTVFHQYQLAEAAIAGVATIDLKADEVGLVEFCNRRNLPLRCYSAETLRDISVPNPSPVVAAEVGTPSVSEAAAILAATPSQPPTKHNPQKVDAATSPNLCVPKQIFRLEGQPGAVTIAVAQSDQEYTGRIGKLWLVGTGPGHLDQITPAAQTAIAQADAVIGYALYIDLIRPLLRPGQIVEALPITQERQRAERAIELADWGLTVAVVSSGDCGIYGMAGLVLEELRSQQWDGKTPQVQVFPGITALQASASRVGTPLMHDFCAISLSNLLTPWEVIEKRLVAAAQANFVVALYNPKSQTRTEQIAIAQQIFLQHRDPHTPVAIVRAAYRDDEQITLTTLEKLLEESIDMLTTILIGNQSTRTYENWMITPRGYFNADAS
jgi:cobalt-precorrin 5A hydrolase / precorrin-3B C17-methyltransferase